MLSTDYHHRIFSFCFYTVSTINNFLLWQITVSIIIKLGTCIWAIRAMRKNIIIYFLLENRRWELLQWFIHSILLLSVASLWLTNQQKRLLILFVPNVYTQPSTVYNAIYWHFTNTKRKKRINYSLHSMWSAYFLFLPQVNWLLLNLNANRTIAPRKKPI